MRECAYRIVVSIHSCRSTIWIQTINYLSRESQKCWSLYYLIFLQNISATFVINTEIHLNTDILIQLFSFGTTGLDAMLFFINITYRFIIAKQLGNIFILFPDSIGLYFQYYTWATSRLFVPSFFSFLSALFEICYISTHLYRCVFLIDLSSYIYLTLSPTNSATSSRLNIKCRVMLSCLKLTERFDLNIYLISLQILDGRFISVSGASSC